MKNRDERALRAREAAAERHEVVTRAREQVGDPSFDRDARNRYWSRLWKYSVVGVVFIVISTIGYAYVAVFNQVVAVGVSLIAFALSIYVLANSRVCGACGGRVTSNLTVYCLECGETYIFHKAGRRKFLQAQELMEAQVRADIEVYHREYGYQERVVNEVDRVLSIRDEDAAHKELSMLATSLTADKER